ncbi:hypothetical protein AXG93_3984s1010 [Marchantia polymorpha subsp. ruderalis]|uniref:Reverse transcriptase Ty1/copia-type domain-containing protein n=1 Tax=Marchantia polymorpha subsp. ruderalis TaxID=1480154 RepID=A0A176W4K7_MARPO|nr:hypothetical protein AXG93_3984s1010 [Marchantia polymorpha subsp. ruderalis]
MKEMGPAKKILGMEITRDRRRVEIFVSQGGYLRKVVAKFGMSESKAVQTPLAVHFKLFAIALSTTKAEFIATRKCVKESLWLKGLIGELGIVQNEVKFFCDNQSAIHLIKNQMFHESTKHIDVKLHFIRDVIAEGFVVVEKVHKD